MYLAYKKDSGKEGLIIADKSGLFYPPSKGWPSKLYVSRPGDRIMSKEERKRVELEQKVDRLEMQVKTLKDDHEKLVARVDSLSKKGNGPSYFDFKKEM